MAEKRAIPKITRDANDNFKVVYLDVDTGMEIPDALVGTYKIVNAHTQAQEAMGAKATTPTTSNPLDETEDVPGSSMSVKPDHPADRGGGEKGSKADKKGFNAYGPTGKDITDTKVGRFGVGLAGGLGGRVIGGVLGGAVGGPIGAMAGSMIGGIAGKKAFTGTSPYAKEQAKKKEAEEAANPEKKGIITRGLEKVGVLDPNKGLLTRGLEAVGVLDPANEASIADRAKKTVADLFSDDEEVSTKAAQGVVSQETKDLAAATPTPGYNPDAPSPTGLSKPGYNPNDSLGRQRLADVNFDKIGLHPDMAAKAKAFQAEALDMGLDLSVDVANTRRSLEDQAALAATGASKTNLGYHNTGFAVDISPTAVDEMGNITDQATLEASRALAAKHDFGLLDPSWDPAHMQANVPGHTARSLYSAPRDYFGNAILSPEQSLGVRANAVPTPTEKPSYDPNKTVSRNIIDQAKEVTPMDALEGVDMSTQSAATLSNLGFGPERNAKQKQNMAFAIAGELSPSQLAALANEDPEAQAEFANVMSTMENRMQSKTAPKNLLDPSQYNSMMAGTNMTNTSYNYSKYADVLNENVENFYSGTISPTNPNATHYYNPDVANPAWGQGLLGSTITGNHKFGNLANEYTPGQAYNESLSRYAGAQINNQTRRGYTPDMGFAAEGPNFGNTSGFSQRGDRNTFGSSASPGVGRSDFSGGGGISGRSSFSGGFGNSGTGSGGLSGGRGGSVSGEGGRGMSKGYGNSGTGSGGLTGGRGGMVSGENAGWGGSTGGRSGIGGSPTNDGGGKSKSPGGGF